MQKLKGYKTFIFGAIVALLPLLDYLTNSDVYTTFISDPTKQKLFPIMLGGLIIFFRAITTTPAFQDKQDKPVDTTDKEA